VDQHGGFVCATVEAFRQGRFYLWSQVNVQIVTPARANLRASLCALLLS
jgi:hypothetical protein